jgi:hypothetical protein
MRRTIFAMLDETALSEGPAPEPAATGTAGTALSRDG